LNKYFQSTRRSLRNWLNHSLFVNAYRLNEKNIARAFHRIQQFQPRFIHGYVSALYMLAAFMQANNLRFSFPLMAVITESEKLYDFQRSAMEAAFGCPVIENYGSVEFGMLATQDRDGLLRIHDDMHVVEQMPVTSEAVVTNLRARAFPFIRYRLGDIIELASEIKPGLPYTVLTKIQGRTVDLIPLVGGGFIPGVSLPHVIDPHLKYVNRYQIHQAKIDLFIIRLVLRQSMPPAIQEKIIADMKHLLGNQVKIEIQVVDTIPLALTGKFRWVTTDVSNLAENALSKSAASPS
jgi:phenylacetate-CoA ligase